MRVLKNSLIFSSGVVVGMILVILGVALGGYLFITADGMMGKVDDRIGDSVPGLDLSEEIRAMSLLQYGTSMYGVLGRVQSAPLGEIEDTAGYSGLSSMLSEKLSMDREALRASTIPNLPQTIIENLKVRALSENFGMELPNFPLFRDEEYLDTPAVDAFGGLDRYTVDKFIVVVYDDNPDPSLPRSSKLVQKLGRIIIGELSARIDGIIEDTTIGELITVDATSEPILRALKDVKLNAEDLNDALAHLKVRDVFENFDSGVLSLISPDTLIKEVPSTLGEAFKSTNLYKLIQLGVLEIDMSASAEQSKSSLYNKTPNTMLTQYRDILGSPADAPVIVAPRIFDVSGVIDQSYIDALATFRNGDILRLVGDASFAANTVFTSVFNVDTNGHTLTIGENVQVDKDGGYMYFTGLSAGAVVGFSNISALKEIKKSPTEIVPAVHIAYVG